MSAEARALIRSLLEPVQSKRLGCNCNSTTGSALPSQGSKMTDVQRHPWWSSGKEGPLDWGALQRRELKAPWLPPLTNDIDTRCFDEVADYEPLSKHIAPYTGDYKWCEGF